MRKWEYLSMRWSIEVGMEKTLNYYGHDGWEVYWLDLPNHIAHMKRHNDNEQG